MRKSLLAVLMLQMCWVPAVRAEAQKFDISGFTVEGNTLLPARSVDEALSPFVGSGRELADVNNAVAALRQLYTSEGYTVVQVTLPEQTLDSGVIVLKVIEDKLVEVTVVGNKTYSEENIKRSLPVLQVGNSINAKQLEAALALVNETSSKKLTVSLKPAAKVGEVGARVDVNAEDSAAKTMLTLDTTGSQSTGYGKAALAYQQSNLFDLDHALSLQATVFPVTLGKAASINAGYHIPMYESGMSTDLIGAYSSSAVQSGSLYFSGKGVVLGAHLNVPLSSIGEMKHKLIWAVDYKDTKNNFTACTGTCGSVTSSPMGLTYATELARPEYQFAWSVSYVANFTTIGSNGGKAAYLAARPGFGGPTASPRWDVWRTNATTTVALPKEVQARFNINAQQTNKLLLPSEQIGAGGASSVRGYTERIISGDKGVVANLELYLPELPQAPGSVPASLRPLVFADVGSVWVNDNLPVGFSRKTTINSYGIGMRLAKPGVFSFNFDIGWAQKAINNGVSIKKNEARPHLSLNVVL